MTNKKKSTSTKGTPIKKKCVGKCSREIGLAQFYKSKNPSFTDGYIPICKQCLQAMIKLDDINTVYNALQLADVPFIYDKWKEAVDKKPTNPLGTYLTMSSLNGMEGMTYKDSIFVVGGTSKVLVDDRPAENKVQRKMDEVDQNELEHLMDKFGYGYTDREYILFEKKHKELKPSFTLSTTMHEECLKEYCIDKVKEGLAKARGDFKEAKEWASMAKDVANSGKLNPNQMTKSDLSGGLDNFGVLNRMIEETDEGELYRVLPSFMEKPKDKVDVVLWLYVNYVRDLKGLPEASYRDIWGWYDERVSNYENTLDVSNEDYFDEDYNTSFDVEDDGDDLEQ